MRRAPTATDDVLLKAALGVLAVATATALLLQLPGQAQTIDGAALEVSLS